MISTADYEIVHCRPREGRGASIQYQPVFGGETTWLLYPGDGYESKLTLAWESMVASVPLTVKQADRLVLGSGGDLGIRGTRFDLVTVLREEKCANDTQGVGLYQVGEQP
ncbi:MAG TPA: hypothetical protein VOA41_07260 [Candidatus Dormibacteraeota bacterium]|nr:hypothetical protein [Candidatus Dormibacteraeota bacterium]